jgi:hypothetical protein
VFIPNCDDQHELKQAVAHYREALEILRTKSEFTTEELATKKKDFEMDLADGGGGRGQHGPRDKALTQPRSCPSFSLTSMVFKIAGSSILTRRLHQLHSQSGSRPHFLFYEGVWVFVKILSAVS